MRIWIAQLLLAIAAALVVASPAPADSFRGNDRANRLVGTPGRDTLRGFGGADRLDGGAGADRIYAGAGNDVIVADGSDIVDAGPGQDLIQLTTSFTERNRVRCGTGRDRVTIYARERGQKPKLARASGCETVVTRFPPGAKRPLPVSAHTGVVPGVPSITSPDSYSWIASSTVVVSGLGEVGSTIHVINNGVVAATTAVPDSGTWTATLASLADGDHAVSAMASNANGTSSSSAVVILRVDTQAPAAPLILAPAEGASISTSFTVSGTAEASSTLELFQGGASLGTTAVALDGTWSKDLAGVAAGTQQFSARTTDLARNASTVSALRTVLVGAGEGPPETALGAVTTGSSSSFAFSANNAAGFQCRLDGPGGAVGAYSACSSPREYGNLAPGDYTFLVRAINAAGSADPTPATHAFTVAAPAPDPPAITSPEDNGWSASSTVVLSGTAAAGSTVTIFEGSTVRGTGTATLSGLWSVQVGGAPDGPHNYVATATLGGSTSAPSGLRTVHVDTLAPAAPAITAPADASLINAADVSISGTAEPGSTVTVLENTIVRGTATVGTGAEWSVTLSAVVDGSHVYTARTTDAAGNQSAASAGRSVRVDTRAPETTISGGTTGTTTETSASFTFSSDEEDATYACRLSGPGDVTGVYQPCSSPRSYTDLAVGSYQFLVRATDAAGNADGSPASTAFTVATPTPSPSPSPTPAEPVADFSVNPLPAVRYSETTFTSTGSCPATPCTYRWVHGELTSTDEIEPDKPQPNTTQSFTYVGEAGPRTVTLKVTDSLGRTAFVTQSFDVVETEPIPIPTPTPSATPNPPTGDFPNESTTGVPEGTTLVSGPGIEVNKARTVIDGVDVPWITVNAPNVTIRNSRIHGSGAWLIRNNSAGLVVEDSELDGEQSSGTAIGSDNYALRRVDIEGVENGVDIGETGNVTIEDSYFHALTNTPTSHTDGVQMGQGARNITIWHSTIRVQDSGPPNSNAAIIMWTQSDPQNSNVRVEYNMLDGSRGTYAIYAPYLAASGIFINNNRMLPGLFGYTASVSVGRTVTEFNDNVDDTTGEAIEPDG